LAHHPEFYDFSVRFDLDRKGLSEPGVVRATSGNAYAFIFIGRSGAPFPSGLEVYAVVDALEPSDGDVLDRDLWSVLQWMIGASALPGQSRTLTAPDGGIACRRLHQADVIAQHHPCA
jgi:hypothetical protein